MKKYLILLIISILITGFYRHSEEEKSIPREVFLDSLQYRTFLYFIHESNRQNGLVRDRSTHDSPASIAATGFGIPVWAAGAEKGWISRAEAAERTLNLFNFLLNSEQSEGDSATGYKGFYYHFLDMNTGKRVWNCELSTIDTGLLLAGIRFAVNYYNNDDSTETKIRDTGEYLTDRVEWNWMILSDDVPDKNYSGTVSMGWSPEEGFHNYGWIGYNEALILYIIAAGSNLRNPNGIYDLWLKHYRWKEPYPGLGHVIFPPLFGHQYSHMFVDFRNIKDDYMREKEIDYFENSRRAALVQREYAIRNPAEWEGYDSLTWGLTACDGPGPGYNKAGREFQYYTARGTSGAGNTMNDDGTIAPTAAGGSFPFIPDEAEAALFNMYNKYGKKGLWGKYGFVDSFNPTLNWYNKDYLGIDQGPIILMIENYRTGFVWKYLMADPVIKKGLEKLNFIN